MLDIWKNIGKIQNIHQIELISNNGKIKKNIIWEPKDDPNFYELELNAGFVFLDFDLDSKEDQHFLSDFDLSIFSINPYIYYLEKSFSKGLHFIVQTKQYNKHANRIDVKINEKQFRIYIEKKEKCIVHPSKNYINYFLNIKSLIVDDVEKLITDILKVIEENTNIKIIKIHSLKQKIEPSFTPVKNKSRPNNEQTDFVLKRKIDPTYTPVEKKSRLNDEQTDFVLKRKIDPTYTPVEKKSRPNDEQTDFVLKRKIDSTPVEKENRQNDSLLDNLTIHYKNFATKLSHKNKFDIYFADLQYFLIFLQVEEVFQIDPFYKLADFDNWLKWTSSFLNFCEILDLADNGISSKSPHKPDIFLIYREITKNSVGRDLTDEQAKEELFGANRLEPTYGGTTQIKLPSFREKYNVEFDLKKDPLTYFLEFIYCTLSVIHIDKKTFVNLTKYFSFSIDRDMKTNFYLTVFQKVLKKYKINVIKTKNVVNKNDLRECGYVSFEGLPWFAINSVFFSEILSYTLPSIDIDMQIRIKQCILDTCHNNELEKTIEKFKQATNQMNFNNLKIVFNHKINDYFGLYIDNYNTKDTVTENGIVNYSFDYEEYLTKGLDDNILCINNVTRYGEEFGAFFKTVYGKDPLSGEFNLFGLNQCLIEIIFICNCMCKNKSLNLMNVKLGPAGAGKSVLLKVINSIFEKQMVWRNFTDIMKAGELSSGLSDLQETHVIVYSEAGIVDVIVFNYEITDSDTQYSATKRNLYKTHTDSINNNSALFIVAANEGLQYDIKKSGLSPYLINDGFWRRQLIIVFENILGGENLDGENELDDGIPNYYTDVKNFQLKSDEMNNNLRKGILYFCLDMIQYLEIGKWDNNKYLRSCKSNMRKGFCKQYKYIAAIRESCIFFDEIYKKDSEEYQKLLREQEYYNAKVPLYNVLLSTNEIKESELTQVNLNIIAHELIEKFKLDLEKDPMSSNWYIRGVKLKDHCNEYEKKSFEKPSGINFELTDLENPQESLPEGLRFYIGKKIRKKFNYLILNNFTNNYKISVNDEKLVNSFTLPIKSKDLFKTSSSKFLKRLKKQNCKL